MIEPLTNREMLLVNGEIVTARDLAAARQQLSHEGVHNPTWDELTPDEQAPGIITAAAYLRSLGRIAPANDRSWYAGELPTFEEIRAEAYGEIGDVLDTLRSDWLPGRGPDDDQADALAEARRLLIAAKEALNRAAR